MKIRLRPIEGPYRPKTNGRLKQLNKRNRVLRNRLNPPSPESPKVLESLPPWLSSP
jgi:hypothetical protein